VRENAERVVVPVRRFRTLRIAATSSKMAPIATRHCPGEGTAVFSTDHKY
jgi:hypothetical protein